MGYRGIYDQDFYLGVVCYLILKDLPADWLQKGGEPEAVDDRQPRGDFLGRNPAPGESLKMRQEVMSKTYPLVT